MAEQIIEFEAMEQAVSYSAALMKMLNLLKMNMTFQLFHVVLN